MKRSNVASVFALTAVLAAWVRADEPPELRGRVLTADGKPAAAVEVAPYWAWDEKGLRTSGATTTDANGEFRLKTTIYGSDRTLFAMDRARQSVGIAGPGVTGGVVEIRLGPAIRFHGAFSCSELGRPATWTNVVLTALPARLPFAQCTSEHAAFAFVLPAGRYKVRAYGAEIADDRREVTLTADRSDMDLGTIDVRPNAIAKFKGKTPPVLTVTDARGVAKTVRLEDFRGKWVLIEFWGYW